MPSALKKKVSDDADNDTATASFSVSLVCPLSQRRITTPCCASTCCHLQCFDPSVYLEMNENSPSWVCPICKKGASYDNLVIDGYFQEVLRSDKLPVYGQEIQMHEDGSWSSVTAKKEQTRMEDSVVIIESDDDDLAE